jgi:hypothetical protein
MDAAGYALLFYDQYYCACEKPCFEPCNGSGSWVGQRQPAIAPEKNRASSTPTGKAKLSHGILKETNNTVMKKFGFYMAFNSWRNSLCPSA